MKKVEQTDQRSFEDTEAFWVGQWSSKQRVGEALWDSDGHSWGQHEVRTLGQVLLLTSSSSSCCGSPASAWLDCRPGMAILCKLGGFTHQPWKDAALRH